MSYFAIVKGNYITNVIVAEDEATALSVSPNGVIAVACQQSDRVDNSWTYDGEKLVSPWTGVENA
jgi:hypothetical protein